MKPKKNPNLEIGRNSSLYFAIGLNLMLLLSWQMLEFKTYEKEVVSIDIIEVENEIEEEIPIITQTIAPPPPPPPIAVQENVRIVEDTEEIEETFIESSETDQDDAIVDVAVVAVSDIQVTDVDEDVEVAFAIIEDVPVFPGCEGLSKAKTKACFQKKIQEHVVKHFTYPQAALDLGLQGRVSVVFIIDSKGYVRGIRSRGPDKLLEEEAERIVGLLPKMRPGKQRGKPVKVAYAVPIFFKFQEG